MNSYSKRAPIPGTQIYLSGAAKERHGSTTISIVCK
jgi:hypothetical protein